MSEYKTLREWNAKKGDVFYYHHPGMRRGGDRVFKEFTDSEYTRAVDEDGRPMLASNPYWHLVARATQPVNYNDGKWHGWNGGECPVHPETIVEAIRLSNDAPWYDSSSYAGNFSWHCIVAFRVVKEHREPREITLDGVLYREVMDQ